MYFVHWNPCHHQLDNFFFFFWRRRLRGIDIPQTEKVKTYSKGNTPWHFPHCCSKLKRPCRKSKKRPWNQIWRHSLYPHLHVRCEWKRRNVLPVQRWGWDCPRDEGGKWRDKSKWGPPPPWMENMEMTMQSVVVGIEGGILFPSLRLQLIRCDFLLFLSYTLMIYL